MALDRTLVGRSYPPSAVYEVGMAGRTSGVPIPVDRIVVTDGLGEIPDLFDTDAKCLVVREGLPHIVQIQRHSLEAG